MTSFWYSEQAEPKSTRSLVTVFFATPVIRTVPRIELPSTKHRTTAARFSVLRTFAILTIIRDRSGIATVLVEFPQRK